MARAHFLFKGVSLPYGTLQEIVAIHIFHRQRAIEGLSPLFASEKFDAEKLHKKLRTLMYPDEEQNDLKDLKKSIDFFKRIRGLDFKVRPV